MGAGLGVAVGVADVSATKSVTAKVMRSTPATRVIASTASSKSPAASSESPTAPCRRFGSDRERNNEHHNGGPGDRSTARQIDYCPVHGRGSLTSANFIRPAFFGIRTAKGLLGIVSGNFQSEITATYSGSPGSVR